MTAVVDHSPTDDQRRKKVRFWLVVAWLLAVGVILTTYYSSDLDGDRLEMKWDGIPTIVALTTVFYFLLFYVVGIASPAARNLVRFFSMVIVIFLIPAVAVLGLLGHVMYNPPQFLLMVVFTFAMFRVARIRWT